QPAHAEFRRSRNRALERLHAGPMAQRAGQPAPLGPPAIAVHHDRDVQSLSHAGVTRRGAFRLSTFAAGHGALVLFPGKPLAGLQTCMISCSLVFKASSISLISWSVIF